jgi:hypothetical protein
MQNFTGPSTDEVIMIVNCPHCGKQLRMSGKNQESIEKLDPGKKIKIKCVHCAKAFGLDASQLESDSAVRVQPPPPPDTAWLKEGVFEDKEVVEDVPQALVLMPDTPDKENVIEAAKAFGYQVETASSAEEAVNKMQFVNYSSVFLHSAYEPGGVKSGIFHRYMRNMKMSRRRLIFYVLIGEEFQTLYDLQALCHSVNLVVNDAEIPYIVTILRKAIPEYEILFGPLMEELHIAGKD